MPKYITRQRKLLLAYLSEHIDEQVSSRQIAAAFENEKISISAVYRNLSELEKEGKIKRCVRENSREVFYQYIAAKECKDSLHLSCRVCGKCFHLDKADADKLINSVEKSKGFQIDKTDTVLYGVCKDCCK